MPSRFWFYLGAVIIMLGEYGLYQAGKIHVANEQSRIETVAINETKSQLDIYLAKQTDERKLISLAKRLKDADRAIMQPIIDRAYELNPNSRDITLLASYFHPELKERVKELDPLYQQR